MKDETLQNAISTQQLYKQYNWFSNVFPEIIQQSYDEFFTPNFELNFIGLSKNINCLLDSEACFVTKIKIDYEYDMFFRLTSSAVEIILNKILGQSNRKFNLNKISELEARIITTFNDFAFEKIKTQINPRPENELKRVNFDLINLTYIIKDNDEYNKKSGKFIVTLPEILLKPEEVTSQKEKFSKTDFPNQHTTVDMLIGKTKFSVYDLKHLEADDIVVFEESSLENMKLRVNGETLSVNLNPNMDLLITDEQKEGDNMNNPDKNIWDSIEVEMIASFDSVKITLGELKDIEEGLVVDLASLYDNKVTLKVEDKSIASGQLVIVNDRYGVKIDEVIAGEDETATRPAKTKPQQNENDNVEGEEEYSEEESEENEYSEDNSEEEYSEDNYEEGEEEENSSEDEFDYTDFDLEDENI